MKYFFESLPRGWADELQYRLVDDKGYVTLTTLFGICATDEDLKAGKLTEAREKTLTYLHTLLQEGKVKVGTHDGGPGIAEEYTGTPNEIINQLRIKWNDSQIGVFNKDPIIFETNTHITLKENPWPVWR